MMSDKQKEIMEETVMLVNLFLETNESDILLGERTGISSSTVGRRLTNRDTILKCFPDNGERLYEIIKEKRKNNLQRGKIIGSQASKLNNLEFMNDTPKLRLDVLYRDERKQTWLLSQLALTFRVNLDTLSQLFDIPRNELESRIMKFNEFCYGPFVYLFYKDKANQELAKARLIEYYRMLLNALLRKDVDTINVLLRELKDDEVREFKYRHKLGEIKTSEEMMSLIKYQLKYALSNNKMASMFHFDRNAYDERVRRELSNNPELESQYNNLIDYYRTNNVEEGNILK